MTACTVRTVRTPIRRQQGTVLIIVLLFLTVLMMMASAAVTSGVAEERLARASRDYNIGFQAAEAALQDAKNDLIGNGSRNPVILGATTFAAIPAGTCSTAGLCVMAAATATPVWENASYWTSNTATYAQFTYALSLPSSGPGSVSQPPRYMIEYIGASGSQSIYRITARGWGPIATATPVTLQEEVLR
jgi:type IV pilus assembly protein PilX